MEDWVKLALKQAATESAQNNTERDAREAQIQTAEVNWKERVLQRVEELSAQGLRLRVKVEKQVGGGLDLTKKGKVSIQFLSHKNFAIKFHDITAPTYLVLRQHALITHHRVVRVRELTPHNIEEALKYVVLGVDGYADASEFKRVERNLEHLVEATNIEERIQS